VREFIEGPEARSQLPDAEKSLINEMCNVSVQVPIILNNKGGGVQCLLSVCLTVCMQDWSRTVGIFGQNFLGQYHTIWGQTN